MMIEAKVAVKAAFEFMNSFLAGYTDILLEEIELSDDDKFWNITLSAIPPPPPLPDKVMEQSVLAAAFQRPKDSRIYKSFSVNSSTGSVKSMKIRVLA